MKTLRITLGAVLSLAFSALAYGQIPPIDDDEPQVRAYTLPLPLNPRSTMEKFDGIQIPSNDDLEKMIEDAAPGSEKQDRLTRIPESRAEVRKKDSDLSFHDQEVKRLLIPEKNKLGVLCVPSFTPEWAITYSPKTNTLTLKEAEKNLWYHHYSFAHWDQSTHKSGEKRPKTYESPKVKTHTLRISGEMKPLLAAIWDGGIGSAVDPNPNVLFFDGVTYEFFADQRRANTRNEKNAYVVFANALKDAILAGDRFRAESLIGEEFQRVLSELHLDIVF